MQTCNCNNTYKYKNECVICGAKWASKTLDQYITELEAVMVELDNAYQATNDLTMRDKYCLVRDIVYQLNNLED